MASGSGSGRAPTEAFRVADDVRQMARRHRVELLIKPTPELVRLFNESPPPATNLILHVTC